MLMMAVAPADAAIEIGKPKDVMCGATKCGALEIDKYQESSGNSTQPVTGFLGIYVNGLFKPVGAIVSKTFNFFQAITNYNSSDRRPQLAICCATQGFQPATQGQR
jgi:hypothetical protein